MFTVPSDWGERVRQRIQPWRPCSFDLGAKVREYVRNLPLRPGATPLKFAPDYEAWLIEAMSHGDYDAFGKTMAPASWTVLPIIPPSSRR